MSRAGNLLLNACRKPQNLIGLSDREWATLLRVARASGLRARLAVICDELGLTARLPPKARTLLEEARGFAEHNQVGLRYEVSRLQHALERVESPIVLLKGGAYILGELPPSRGRTAGDLDILVPKAYLGSVEQTLLTSGWEQAELSSYDQHYYRDWMHEIPPIWHPDRRVVIDIHHTIVPLTSRFQPNAQALFERAVEVQDSRVKVLCPADMVLHSAAHLFHEEFGLGLRDLLDLHDLLEHFGKEQGFWADLSARARLHGLDRTLFYLLRYTQRLLGTKVPNETLAAARTAAPNPFLLAVMDLLFVRALTPPTPGAPHPGRAVALWLLYVRSHWLRMPPLLLARHLLTKALRRRRERTARGSPQAEAKPH